MRTTRSTADRLPLLAPPTRTPVRREDGEGNIEWLEAHARYHETLLAASPNQRLRTITNSLRDSGELYRVLRPGGRLAVLEITTPRGPLRPFCELWFERLVPLLGRVLPGGRAYTYLPASVRRFPPAEELAGLLSECGFAEVRFKLLAGSIVALHTGSAA